MAYKVVIAEDYKMVRGVFEGIVEDAREFTLAASFASAEEAKAFCLENKVDLLIMDVLFPGEKNGLLTAAEVKSTRPDMKVILVTSMPEISWIRRAKEAGVDSFWYKEVQEQPLLSLMQRTMDGESVYPLDIPRINLGNISTEELTDRETDVLHELVSGASNKEIGERLNITEKTVKMHITNLLQKTGMHSRLELALTARNLGVAISDE